MMSPEEVRTVTFDRQNMGGYRRADVDAFLQQAADELEAALQEKAAAEKKLMVLAQKIEEYRKDEENVKTALLNAQRMAESIIREARQKSEAMIREAGIKADDLVQSAKGQVRDEEIELERVQGEVARFKADILQLYKQHIESLSSLPGEVEEPAEEPAPAEGEMIPEVPAEAAAEPQALPQQEENAIRFDFSEEEEPAPAEEEPQQPEDLDATTEITFDLSGLVEEVDEAPKKGFAGFESFQGIKFSD